MENVVTKFGLEDNGGPLETVNVHFVIAVRDGSMGIREDLLSCIIFLVGSGSRVRFWIDHYFSF